MAVDVVIQERSETDPGFWPAFFRHKAVANARFWLDHVTRAPSSSGALDRERDNVAKALSIALQVEAAWQPAIELLLASHRYVEWHGSWREWEPFLAAGLEISRRREDVASEAAIVDRLGDLKRNGGDLAAAIACHQLAAQLNGQIGNDVGRARALANLGHVHRLRSNYAEASRVLEESLAICEQRQALDCMAIAHTNLGFVHFVQGQSDQALAHHEAAYQCSQQTGDLAGMARGQHNKGIAFFQQGNLVGAESCLQRATALYEQTHARFYAAAARMDLGNVYLKEERLEQAETSYREAQKVMEQVGFPRGLANALNNLGMVYTRQARYDLAQESLQRSVALYAQLAQPVDQANAEGNLAEAYLAEQEWEAASRILHQAVARLTGLEPTPRITNLLAEIDTLVQRAAAGSFQEAEQ